MERTHPRDIAPAARAAMASLATTTTTTSSSDSLLRRGLRIARSTFISPRCVSNAQMNTCEKPAQSTNENLGVMVAGGVIAFIAVIVVLIMLHLRRNRREMAEFANDRHELSDYGLDEVPVKRGMGGTSQHVQGPAPNIPPNQLSAKQLADLQNPFGAGAEMADAPKPKGSPPPRYPDAVKM
ncbi:hypothetical protein VMCG_06071 [Cytospora schulzeri]|uniref:Uncharacterized protein n=1 Tax=Cytospora schulzeri TaxID=448051 RepID=A0A423WGC1_9PEZI|nr:hypothetical protein VMCG_06071 [Valsa malicola]